MNRMGRWMMVGAVVGVAACTSAGEESGDPAVAAIGPAVAPGTVEFVRPGGSGEPHLSVAPDGTTLLTWFEPAGDHRQALRVASRADGRWSEPRTVRESEAFFVNWADFPSSVRMRDGTIAVHWLEKVDEAPYAYHVMVSLSGDEGETWSDPVRVHDDDSPTEHGFVSMVPWEDGAAIVWLDGRGMRSETPPVPGGAHAGPRGSMSVRFRTLAADGTMGPEVLLDPRTCECCQTSLAITAEGLLAAYRDRSPEEVRDIATVRGLGETWSEPVAVSRDGWTIHGCPVNGPQLSAAGREVAIAWYTGVGGEPQVYAAFSSDGGASFGDRIRVDRGLPLGRVDIERLDDGSAIVTWLDASGDAARVLARRIGPDGDRGEILSVAETSGSRASGFPRLARTGGELLVAWTLPGEDGGVRVRSLRIDD